MVGPLVLDIARLLDEMDFLDDVAQKSVLRYSSLEFKNTLIGQKVISLNCFAATLQCYQAIINETGCIFSHSCPLSDSSSALKRIHQKDCR